MIHTYNGWDRYNHQIIEVVRGLSPDQLAIRPAPDRWPIWATVGHMAEMRVYWLCNVFGEPGAESTPFADLADEGWEDDLDTPRTADELVDALESTWQVIDSCLQRWTPEMLGEEMVRETPTGRQWHTRQSVLMRMLTHDAYHAGELSQTLGIHQLTQIDLWAPIDQT